MGRNSAKVTYFRKMIYGETNLKGAPKMGKIRFKDEMEAATWKTIKETHDCVDVATDLLRI